MKNFCRFHSNLFFAFIFISFTFSIFQFQIFAQTDDDQEIKVESSLVIINAFITDKNGKSVLGLKKSDFKVFEDSKEQAITLDFFQAQETPFAVVILMDTSGSMEQRVSLARSAAINFLGGLRTEDNVAIYNFDSKVSLVQDFSDSRDITEKAFDLKADGMTVLNDAVYQAAQLLEKRTEKRRAIIVLSDGADNRSKFSAGKALKAALDANALIYTVDMSSPETELKAKLQNTGILKNFAEKTGGKYISTPGGVQLRETFKNIVEEIGNQYTFGYEPNGVKKDGKWHTIEVRVSRPNLKIRAREGYNAAKVK
ncbi:MAG: VWA domain-containing protein [Pyrinomonadaceae bacterium]